MTSIIERENLTRSQLRELSAEKLSRIANSTGTLFAERYQQLAREELALRTCDPNTDD